MDGFRRITTTELKVRIGNRFNKRLSPNQWLQIELRIRKLCLKTTGHSKQADSG